jgi:tetratricopeptide (TPR) repeat protein
MLAGLLAAVALAGQQGGSCAIEGTVRDPHNRLVNAAVVQLKSDGGTVSAKTDSTGKFRFSGIRAATYTVHAEAPSGETNFGPFVLWDRESRSIDLTLVPAEKPAFFDEQAYIVAGVTDSSQRGGHGADPIVKASGELAKATESLGGVTATPNDVETIRGYQEAAEKEPSEAHLFVWGAELLRHRAADRAIDVFARGCKLFPRSMRMLLGLGSAYYAHGSFADAEQTFIDASDLNPPDPLPYLFLGKARNSAIGHSDDYVSRMARFAKLVPENALAHYYYAMCSSPPAAAELEKAVSIDPHLGRAWLELGILSADRNDLPKAIEDWERATASNEADEIAAHYRLAQAYRRTGDTRKAASEIEVYERLSKQATQEDDREWKAIRELVFKLR